MKKVIGIGVVSILMMGCSTLNLAQDRYIDLAGPWTVKDSSLGSEVVTFKQDYTYTVDVDGDGKNDIWGRYNIFKNQINLHDLNGSRGPDCYEGAAYEYKRGLSELRFYLVGDQCLERVKTFSSPWVRPRSKR